ncbi:MAG: V-type ATP synthase subunit A, partial [Gemmatimonadetes bacterium]|nr:V-type ATP synthase subunit A [Gemmatimonadota bacterium]
MTTARVIRAAGALVEAAPLREAGLFEIVRVGPRGLLGEVIRLDGDVATIQVFEDTGGLALEDPVVPTGAPLLAELGPGLLGSVLDGTGRPLERLAAAEGAFIGVGTV